MKEHSIGKIRSIKEAIAILETYIPAVREFTGKDITLERIGPMMNALGNPQDKLKIIHVAGTSGKTSTAYYIASLLQAEGRKVGLTVSPHIDSITERAQINLQPISNQEFCLALEEFLEIIGVVSPRPSYFELLVAFVYWYFAKEGVDYAVIETGFGGLHDATNIAQVANKICVITDIGYDHMLVLGNTLPLISAQKAGIIHAGNDVYMYAQSSEIMGVFEPRAATIGATLHKHNQHKLEATFATPELQRLPLFQQRNWLLARAVIDAVAQRDGWQVTDKTINFSLGVQVPGRMEVVQVQGVTVLMDGAHNEHKMRAFVRSYQAAYGNVKTTLLVGFKSGKDFEPTLPLLRKISDSIIVTSFTVSQDMNITSADAATVGRAALEAGFYNVQVIADTHKAFSALLASGTEHKIVTGSFYLLAAVRAILPEGMQ